jgi:hypothetical protein
MLCDFDGSEIDRSKGERSGERTFTGQPLASRMTHKRHDDGHIPFPATVWENSGYAPMEAVGELPEVEKDSERVRQ